ncbi:MAG: DUF4924 family protein [Flavobacteriales bacterium]|jgi:hypothetical protein
MTLAGKKKAENVIEYILYLWQMQDLVRAAGFDLGAVRHFMGGGNDELNIDEELEWFAGIITAMKANGVDKKGNLPEIDELLIELNYLHHTLIDLIRDAKYIEVWTIAQPLLDEFLQRSGNPSMNPIEAMLTSLYGLLVLRLRGQEPTAATLTAIDAFKVVLVKLGGHYHDMRRGSNHFSMN